MKKVRLLALSGMSVVGSLNAAMADSNSAAPALPRNRPLNLAILIFDGVQIIDYTGPYETFGHAYNNDEPLFNIYTVAPRAESITTEMGSASTLNTPSRLCRNRMCLLCPAGTFEIN